MTPDAPWSPTASADALAEGPAGDGLVRVMDDALANKIAAGEVVQRPASVLKELLENALDAGARNVQVVVRRAGAELVQVVDDGGGMGPQDAAACFGRHATSKLRRIEDLERLRTLGFRGEALASVAAVAQVELRTRREGDAVGTRVRIEGGRALAVEPCAAPAGTSLAVRNLFYNVPARRNFLKSPATEFKHLVETFQWTALSHPAVGFALLHDDAEVFRLPASAAAFEDALRARLRDLVGDRAGHGLVPVAESTSYLTVLGFVGAPDAARRGRGDQFAFVNGRYVRHRGLDHAVASAFGEGLPKGLHPLYALFLHIEPRHVDVNVHPTKTEVKFDDESGVYGFVRAVVRKGLGDAHLVPDFAPAPRSDGGTVGQAVPPAPRPSAARPATDADPPRPIRLAPLPSAVPAPPAPMSGGPRPAPLRPAPAPFPAGDAEGVPEAHPAPGLGLSAADLAEWDTRQRSTVWSLHGRFLLAPIPAGLLVVDPHAAHQRILYERALAAFGSGSGGSQRLLFPHTVELAPADLAVLDELLPDLQALGFELEVFSGRTVAVHGVPADVRAGEEQRVLAEVIEQYRSNEGRRDLTRRENLARSVAARNAMRPGTPLGEAEAHALIDALFACQVPYVDPGGRPTLVRIPLDELAARFAG